MKTESNLAPIALRTDAMNAVVDVRELVHRFNKDEAIWRSFEKKREVSRRLRADSLISNEILDAIDWREAEREHRNVQCIGFPLPCG